MSDLNYQNMLPVQSNQQPDPVTIASSATIAPTTALSIITGTAQLETITPPVSGYCEITLVFTNGAPGLFLTSGNILTAYQPIQNRPVKLFYNKPTNKWYVMSVT